MKASRLVAVGLVGAAGLWILSGYLLPRERAESEAAVRPNQTHVEKLFRVGVIKTPVEPHSQKLVLSGRTEADHKVSVAARTSGVLTDLKVKRGQNVKKGDVLAILSDEAREAQVEQARAMVTQRQAELEAKKALIEKQALPKLDLVGLESQLKIAQAQLAAAIAESNRGVVTAPWDGVITDVPIEVGGAAFSMAGREIATLVALDPMLAVVEVAERNLAGLKVGEMAKVRLITGETATGRVRYVSKSASPTTRTYRVEVEIANPDHSIPDGITAEVAVKLAPAPAARVPRSALTFSSAGDLGVRVVNKDGVVEFSPVSVVEDQQNDMWVSGIADDSRVIVQGQDFVHEGQHVEAIVATSDKTAEN